MFISDYNNVLTLFGSHYFEHKDRKLWVLVRACATGEMLKILRQNHPFNFLADGPKYSEYQNALTGVTPKENGAGRPRRKGPPVWKSIIRTSSRTQSAKLPDNPLAQGHLPKNGLSPPRANAKPCNKLLEPMEFVSKQFTQISSSSFFSLKGSPLPEPLAPMACRSMDTVIR